MNFPLRLVVKMIINGFSSFTIHKTLQMMHNFPMKWGKKKRKRKRYWSLLLSITPDKSVNKRLTFMNQKSQEMDMYELQVSLKIFLCIIF